MKGTIEHFTVGERECSIYLPPDYTASARFPVVYMNTDELQDIISILEPHIGRDCAPFIMLNIDTVNWDDDMTPWPAPALSGRSGAFGGHADAYLGAIVTSIKPYVDVAYNTKPGTESTALIGYSLAGLTALYALYKHQTFGKLGSMSGSLWYDGWLDYMRTHKPLNNAAQVYLSLGSKEAESKNPRMAAVGKCTEEAAELLKTQLSPEGSVTFEWNPGGHFTEIPQRFLRALLWLMRT